MSERHKFPFRRFVISDIEVILFKVRQREESSSVIFWLEICRANRRSIRRDKHALCIDKIYTYFPLSFSLRPFVIVVWNIMETNTIFQASFVITICSNTIKRDNFYCRPYSKSSLTLTLNDWKFNLSLSRVSLPFLNSWRVSVVPYCVTTHRSAI